MFHFHLISSVISSLPQLDEDYHCRPLDPRYHYLVSSSLEAFRTGSCHAVKGYGWPRLRGLLLPYVCSLLGRVVLRPHPSLRQLLERLLVLLQHAGRIAERPS